MVTVKTWTGVAGGRYAVKGREKWNSDGMIEIEMPTKLKRPKRRLIHES